MTANITSVIKPVGAYERLQAVAEKAGITVLKLSEEAGVTGMTLYHMKHRGPKGGAWTAKTLNAVSEVLAERLNRRPSEIYAYLTGLEEIEL